jgi:hypothetical protein
MLASKYERSHILVWCDQAFHNRRDFAVACTAICGRLADYNRGICIEWTDTLFGRSDESYHG